MAQVEAVYESGVFRPVRPIQLPERSRVTVDLDGPCVEQLPDEDVLKLAGGFLSAGDQEALSGLLESNREGLMTAPQRDRLDELMGAYRRGMVLKARAVAEAVARGLMPRLNGDGE